jgi:hypothetical protein
VYDDYRKLASAVESRLKSTRRQSEGEETSGAMQNSMLSPASTVDNLAKVRSGPSLTWSSWRLQPLPLAPSRVKPSAATSVNVAIRGVSCALPRFFTVTQRHLLRRALGDVAAWREEPPSRADLFAESHTDRDDDDEGGKTAPSGASNVDERVPPPAEEFAHIARFPDDVAPLAPVAGLSLPTVVEEMVQHPLASEASKPANLAILRYIFEEHPSTLGRLVGRAYFAAFGASAAVGVLLPRDMKQFCVDAGIVQAGCTLSVLSIMITALMKPQLGLGLASFALANFFAAEMVDRSKPSELVTDQVARQESFWRFAVCHLAPYVVERLYPPYDPDIHVAHCNPRIAALIHDNDVALRRLSNLCSDTNFTAPSAKSFTASAQNAPSVALQGAPRPDNFYRLGLHEPPWFSSLRTLQRTVVAMELGRVDQCDAARIAKAAALRYSEHPAKQAAANLRVVSHSSDSEGDLDADAGGGSQRHAVAKQRDALLAANDAPSARESPTDSGTERTPERQSSGGCRPEEVPWFRGRSCEQWQRSDRLDGHPVHINAL